MFRDLRADEVELRVGMVKKNGCSLLLYKDARCDMNILDELGLAWQCEYYQCKDTLFCKVGIKTDNKLNDEWIWKSNAGDESNTEARKGEASDAFKRACFCWGIGRELYTAPFIWIDSSKYEKKNGSDAPKDTFTVTKMTVDDKKIVELEIVNDKTKETVFKMGTKMTYGESKIKKAAVPYAKKSDVQSNKTRATTLCRMLGHKATWLIEQYGISAETTEERYAEICDELETLLEK